MAKIKEIAAKYKLDKDDFWQHKQSNQWILKHSACEKIQAIEGIKLTDVKVLNSEENFARFLITMTLNTNESTSTIGEASSSNCMSKYIGCMAEKRGIGRAILKLINAYQYGIASEVEADDFKKDKPKKTWTKTNIEQGKVEDLL